LKPICLSDRVARFGLEPTFDAGEGRILMVGTAKARALVRHDRRARGLDLEFGHHDGGVR